MFWLKWAVVSVAILIGLIAHGYTLWVEQEDFDAEMTADEQADREEGKAP